MKNTAIDYGNKVIYRNSVLSIIYKAVSAALSFISAPLLLYCLGEEKYGAWASLLSFISWVYYCDLGIGNGLRNKLAGSLALDDYVLARKYIGISYTLISTISTLVFIAALIGIRLFDISAFLGLSFSDESIDMCLIAAAFFACLNFVMSLVNNLLYALQKASLVNLFSVAGQIAFIILLAVYALTGIKLIFFVALAEGISQFLKNLIETIYVFKKNPELRFKWQDIDKNYSNGILSFGLQMFLIQIASLVLNSTDNLIITKLFGAAAVTPYSFCYKYFNMINMFYVALITPLLSAYTAAYARKDFEWILKSLKKNGILFVIFSLGTIAAAVIFKPFTLVWLRKELVFSKGLILCTTLYFIILMFNHIFSTFIVGISKVKENTVMIVIGTVINIPLSIFLAQNAGLGTTGVILGSVVSSIVGIWVAPIVTAKEIKKFKIRKKVN